MHPNCWKPWQLPGWWRTGETCHGRSWDSTNSSCHLAGMARRNQRFAGCSSTLWVDSCTQLLQSVSFCGVTYHWCVLVTSCHSAAWGSSNQHVPERDAKQSSRSTEANDVGPSCGAFLVLGGWMFGRGCRLLGGWLSKKHLNRMGSCQMDPRSNSLSVTVMEAAYFR